MPIITKKLLLPTLRFIDSKKKTFQKVFKWAKLKIDLSHSIKEILIHIDSSLPYLKYWNYDQLIDLKVVGNIKWQKTLFKDQYNSIWSTKFTTSHCI